MHSHTFTSSQRSTVHLLRPARVTKRELPIRSAALSRRHTLQASVSLPSLSMAAAHGQSSDKVQVAVVGTGTFAKGAWSPLFGRFADDCAVRYVWSRSEGSATKFVDEQQEDIGTPNVVFGDSGFEQMLQDAELQAMVVVLPAPNAQQYIQAALAAGKHVLSEKPMAPTLAQARQALESYNKLEPRPFWSVAENFRFEKGFEAAQQVREQLGTLLKVDLLADMGMRSGNKFFTSTWRRDGQAMPGGFMVDSAVHHMAALRRCMGSDRPVSARAVCSSRDSSVSSPDTVLGSIEWASGVSSSVSMCLSTLQPSASIRLVGTKGTAEVSRAGWDGSASEYKLRYKVVAGPSEDSGDASTSEDTSTFEVQGMDLEFKEFLSWVQAGKGDRECGPKLGNPNEAFLDLAMIEALLEAGKTGQVVDVQRLPNV